MKKEAYEVEYYEPKSVLAMQADRREEKHRRKPGRPKSRPKLRKRVRPPQQSRLL